MSKKNTEKEKNTEKDVKTSKNEENKGFVFTSPEITGKSSGSSERTPNWTCIVYEDSLPDDYIEQLEESAIEVCISPWHDMDVWTEHDEKLNPEHKAGTKKKKHKHIVLMYGKGNKKSLKQVKEDFAFLNGTNFKRVKNLPGIIQYLDHRFCKTKHHYDERGVVALNGFDYEEVVNTPTESQNEAIYADLCDFCIEYDVRDFYVMQLYVNHHDELKPWRICLKTNESRFYRFIMSYRCAKEDAKKNKRIDPYLALMQKMNKCYQEEDYNQYENDDAQEDMTELNLLKKEVEELE